jgi:hypothetical protein
MSEDKFTFNFNNYPGSSVEEQIGHVENLTVTRQAKSDPASVNEDEDEDEGDGQPGQALG